jgi:uncharacterized protein (DUF2126 family)
MAQDVRLTMGGEPTFVSIDDFESEEWNTAAVGPTKREKADELIRKLRERFAPGGFLHYGQGKWYPGESLPRWTFSLYWRKDGKPIWQRPGADRRRRQDTGHRPKTAKPARRHRQAELAIEPEMICRPTRIRPNGSSRKAACRRMSIRPIPSSKDPEERSRIARVFERGLTTPPATSCRCRPGTPRPRGQRWVSEKWKTRRGKMFLVPGDSPVGYRLPLGTLPYVPPARYPYIHPSIPRSRAPLAVCRHGRQSWPTLFPRRGLAP